MDDAGLVDLLASVALSDSDTEAENRFKTTRSADPYPEIPSALLNTADLLSYVAATGMVHPLRVDPEAPSKTLKPASCAISVLGPYLTWRGSGRDQQPDTADHGELGVDEELILERNSIVYVTLEPTFRLPDYIAGRFNLTIRDIYRGMLVGTGPLVDPGFQGHLSLPLHNLTANDYVIVGGEPFVWMEFTKLSPHARWSSRGFGPARTTVFVPFPRRKLVRQSVREYVRYAYEGPIRSSIPELVGETASAASHAASEAQKARGETSRVRRTFVNVSLVAVVAVLISLAALLLQGFGYVNNAREDVDATRRQNLELLDRLDQQAGEIQELERRIRPLPSERDGS